MEHKQQDSPDAIDGNPTVILYLGHTAQRSGAELCLVRLLTAIDRDRVTPVVVLAEDGPIIGMLHAIQVETHVMPLDNTLRKVSKDAMSVREFLHPGRILRIISYAARLAKFARQRGVHVIHTNSMKAHFYGGLAGRLARLPVVWHIRDFINESYLPKRAVQMIRGLARVIPARVIAVSHSVLSQVHLGDQASKGKVVYDGLTAEELSPRMTKPLKSLEAPARVGMIGRLMPWKGQHVFLEAAAAVLQADFAARFLVVGGPLFGQEAYEEQLHRQAETLGITSQVDFLGFRSDVPEILAGLDILVHASTSADPLPGTVLEGQAEGLPVIGSDGGGVPEMIQHGKTGLLAPMGDADTLADRIKTLLSDPVQARRLGEAGFKSVRSKFTVERTARGVEEVYAGIISPKQKARPSAATVAISEQKVNQRCE